jgi:hypothetical protein
MNVENLCQAVWGGREWLDHFNRREYEKSFQRYMEQFGDVYAQAVRETGGDETRLRALAEAVVDGIEAGWKRQRIWNRAAVRVDEKQVIVTYLSPMLMGREEEGCRTLAELLRDGWRARWPKNAYEVGDYKTIRKGFHNVVLGVDLDRLNRSGDDDDSD